MSDITIQRLFIHFIKGLTPHECDWVPLKRGSGIPGDRAFALLYGEPGQVPREKMNWLRKQHFAMQCDWPGLAALETHYNPETTCLTVCRQGVELLSVPINTLEGRSQVSHFFTEYLSGLEPAPTARHPEKAPLYLVGLPTGKTRYPDRAKVHISLVGQATLDHLSELAGESVDARRFRPNFVIQGVPAWEEFTWVGRQFQLGTARIEVTAPINRCPNIDVHPETGDRQLPLLALLQSRLGHVRTGVVARVLEEGIAQVGDRLVPV